MKEKKYSLYKDRYLDIKKDTICQVHRDIFNKVDNLKISSDDKKWIMDLLDFAYDRAKAMDRKLKWYKEIYSTVERKQEE